MLNEERVILNHYRRVAQTHGASSCSTMKDPYIREAEIQFFIKEIQRYKSDQQKDCIKILDIGCGNGYLLGRLEQEFPNDDKFAIELTPEFAEIASARKLPRTSIINSDGRKLGEYFNNIDICITERVLINILHEKHRKELVTGIKKVLVDNGVYLMSESFCEGLRNLNRARKEMRLHKLSQSEQNRYLKEQELGDLLGSELVEIPGLTPKNFLSTHFYVTRVLHNLYRPEKSRLEGTEFVKFFDEGFGPAVGDYSPINFRVFKK